MSTRLTWSRTGLVLKCETAKRPLPRTAWAFALPPFAAVNTVSPGITTAFVNDGFGFPQSLRVTNLEELPTGYDYTLNLTSYEGSLPGTLRGNTIQLGKVRAFSQDIALGLEPATLLVYLSRAWSGIREDYAQVTVPCPGVGVPDAPSGLFTYAQGNSIFLGWSHPRDGSVYEVRIGDSINSALPLLQTGEMLAKIPQAGTYWVTAIRYNKFSAPASINVSEYSFAQNIVQTYTEDFRLGTLTGGAVVNAEGLLRLTGGTLFDSLPGLFDSLPGLFDDLSGLAEWGEFESPNVLDLGSPKSITVTESYGYTSATPETTAAQTYIAIDRDGTGYSAWQVFAPGQYYGQRVKRKVRLTCRDLAGSSPMFGPWTWTVDMPDRLDENTGLVTPAIGNYVWTYATPFMQKPNVQLTVLDGAAGDVFVEVAADASHYEFRVTNGGSTVVRTVNALAKGF